MCFATSSLLAPRAVRIIGACSAIAQTPANCLAVMLPFSTRAGPPETATGGAGWLAVAGLGKVTWLVLAGSAYRTGMVDAGTPTLATECAIAAVFYALMGQCIAPMVGALLLVIAVGIVMAAAGKDREPLDHEQPAVAVLLATAVAVAFGPWLYSTGPASAAVPSAWALLPRRPLGPSCLS
jgi:hypothetical protein